MENYELLYVLPAKYTEGELTELTNKIGGIITALGAKISETHNLGSRRLSYPIQKERNGVYILTYFSAETSAMHKMNETLRLSTDLLRHLIVTRNPAATFLPNFTEMEAELQAKRRARNQDERGSFATIPASAAPVAATAPVSMEDLDKKLDEMLTEEVK